MPHASVECFGPARNATTAERAGRTPVHGGGRRGVREIALGLGAARAEAWPSPSQRSTSASSRANVLGLWRVVVAIDDVPTYYGRRPPAAAGSATAGFEASWQSDFFDVGHVGAVFTAVIREGTFQPVVQKRMERV